MFLLDLTYIDGIPIVQQVIIIVNCTCDIPQVYGTFINTGIQAHVSSVGQQMFLLDLRCIDRIPIVQQVIITLPVCRGRDRMVVEFTTTHAISAYHYWCCEFES